MKQFLRYQISGMVFVGWVIIFYLGAFPQYPLDTRSISEYTLGGFFTALSIGVMIHQLSVLIKNSAIVNIPTLFISFLNSSLIPLSDHPKDLKIKALIKKNTDGNLDHTEYAKYILERISNLNSFYYVRFDNGFLAPILALMFVIFVLKIELQKIAHEITIMFVIAIIILAYIPRIINELERYRDELKKSNESNEFKTNQ